MQPHLQTLLSTGLLLQQQVALSARHRNPAVDLCQLSLKGSLLIPHSAQLLAVPFYFPLYALLQLH